MSNPYNPAMTPLKPHDQSVILRALSALMLVLSFVACGSNKMTGPSNSTTCRTYATTANVTAVSGGATQNALVSASFDSSTRKNTVTTMFANGGLCSTAVFSYSSVADFVDEIRVIPGVVLSLSNVNTNSGLCGTATATVTNAFDAQRRLQTVTTSPGGVTTYTAWDNSGRPTTGTTNTGVTITNVYDNTARTVTQTQVGGGTNTVNVQSFDTNGIQTTSVVTGSAGSSTTTFTTTSTTQVCK